jgi:hypothetical protein
MYPWNPLLQHFAAPGRRPQGGAATLAVTGLTLSGDVSLVFASPPDPRFLR